MVVIVCHGYLIGKYDWVIQNNQGGKFCDVGFIKIEFGQVGTENVARFNE